MLTSFSDFFQFINPKKNEDTSNDLLLALVRKHINDIAEETDMGIFVEEDVDRPNDVSKDSSMKVIECGLNLEIFPKDVTVTDAKGLAIWYRQGKKYICVEAYNDGGIGFLCEGVSLPTWMVEGSNTLESSMEKVKNLLSHN